MSDPTESRTTVQAIISYALILLLALTVLGVFLLIAFGVKVDPTMLTVLGTAITAVIACGSAVTAFWLGSSTGSQKKDATLAQMASAPEQSEP